MANAEPTKSAVAPQARKAALISLEARKLEREARRAQLNLELEQLNLRRKECQLQMLNASLVAAQVGGA